MHQASRLPRRSLDTTPWPGQDGLMDRILEPEYMDTQEEAQEYDAMDHVAANESVLARFLEIGGGRGRAVDLGTGPGHIPVLIARARPEARIVAVDAAQTMLDLARERVDQAGLADRITLQQANVRDLPFGDDSFDEVFSNSILHHIPDPLDFLREAWRVLVPGGVLLIRDLFRPASEGQAWALVDEHAAGASDCQRQLLFDSLHAALTLEEARSTVAEVGMSGASVEMSSDRHYTIECH